MCLRTGLRTRVSCVYSLQQKGIKIRLLQITHHPAPCLIVYIICYLEEMGFEGLEGEIKLCRWFLNTKVEELNIEYVVCLVGESPKIEEYYRNYMSAANIKADYSLAMGHAQVSKPCVHSA